MISPAVTAQRLGVSLLLGLFLGLVYSVLRPFGKKHRQLADLVFVLAVGAVWVYQSFGLCRGDLRPGYWAGLAGGCVLWEMTLGRWLRPVFFFFYGWFDNIFGFPFRLIRKIFIKITGFYKILFASVKKWGTINRIKKTGERPGGKEGPRGRKKRKDPAGVQAQQQRHEDSGAGRNLIIYGGSSGAGQRHS